MVVDSGGMRLKTMAQLMTWARHTSTKRGLTMQQLLKWVRERIDDQVRRELQQP